MRTPEKADISRPTSEQRIIGSIDGDRDGPTIIALTGVHGNEQAGVKAVDDVIDKVQEHRPDFHGKLIGIRSNLKALHQNVRYIDEDMNRLWFPAIIKKIRETPEQQLQSSERAEMKQLLQVLDEINKQADSTVILADLHTFSAEGCMFTITNHVPQQVNLLSKLYSPMVFGIEETLRGTALAYHQKQNYISFGLEGGQHDNKISRYNMTASMMLLLCAAGCIEHKQIPEFEEYQKHLKSYTKELPTQTELVYQHIIEPGDNFVMRPGYKNFQRVEKGEWLASDKDGKIESEVNGYILMPLYQEQGDDGFFIISGQDS